MHAKSIFLAAGIALVPVAFTKELAPFPVWGELYVVSVRASLTEIGTASTPRTVSS